MLKRWLNWTIKFLTNQRGNLQKMLTPPKSKSPWEAMTSGSSGGWAGFAGPTTPKNPNDPKGWGVVGPALTMASGLIPGVGPLAAMGMGAMGAAGTGGFQGTDSGWGKGIMDTAGGALMGYGMGGIGKGIQGGAQSLLTGGGLKGAGSGFMGGVNQYLGTPIIPGMAGSAPASWMAPAGGGITSPYPLGQTGTASGGAGMFGIPGTGAAGTAGTMGMPGGAGGGFNLGNLAMKTLGGAGLLGASAMMKPPSIGTRPDMARQATEMPNLVEAQGMMRDLAMMNPSELVGPAGDQYIEASLRQTRQAHQYQRQQTINDFASQGKTIGKSGSANERLARMDEAQAQRESDFITQTNEARYIAGINTKIQTVSNYLQMSQEQAADLLASYGYISPEDLLNYQSALASYQGTQQALGQAGGMMLAPQGANIT